MHLSKIAGFILLLILLVACGTAPQKDSVPPVSQEEFSALQTVLEDARAQQLFLYAPTAFRKLEDLYNSALKNATERPAKAREQLTLGKTLAAEFEAKAQANKQLLAEVDIARTSAAMAGATGVHARDMQETDEELADIAARLEKDPQASVQEDAQELVTIYRKLELSSLKLNILGDADRALTAAAQEELADFAPQTMRLAEEEYLLGTSVLNADRSQTEKAARHAANVMRHINHARSLSEHIKSLQANKSSLEDVLLWHEAQMAEATASLGLDLDFSQGTEPVVAAVLAKIATLYSRIDSLEADVAAGLERETALKKDSAARLSNLKQDMEQQMIAVQLATDAEKRRVAEVKKRFEFVQNLFSITEAEVYQQGQNVLIRAYGFTFKPGSSEVTEENLTLLNKLIDAVEVFQDSQVEVSGHTDTSGNRRTNQRLSDERAKNVAEFLVIAGQVAKERVNSRGYGSSRPVATNDTTEGRAANRRVEILIINPESDL